MRDLVGYLFVITFALLGVTMIVIVVKTAIIVFRKAKKKSGDSK